MDPQAQSSQSFQSLVAHVNMQDMLQKLGVSNSSEADKQKVGKKIAELLLHRVSSRIAPILTKEDVESFKSLDSADPTGEAGKQFLLVKVPGLETIIKEEAGFLAEDIAGSTYVIPK